MLCVCVCACIGSSWATPSLLWFTVKWLWSHSSTRCRVGCIYLVLTFCPEVLLLPQREANKRPRRVSYCRAGTWPEWEPRAPGPVLGRFTTTHSHTWSIALLYNDAHPTHEGAQANRNSPLVSSPDLPHQSLNLHPLLPMTCSNGGFLGVGILSLANSPISNYLSGSQMLDGKVTCTRKAGISISILTILITLILLSATCLQPFPPSVGNQLYFNTKIFQKSLWVRFTHYYSVCITYIHYYMYSYILYLYQHILSNPPGTITCVKKCVGMSSHHHVHTLHFLSNEFIHFKTRVSQCNNFVHI